MVVRLSYKIYLQATHAYLDHLISMENVPLHHTNSIINVVVVLDVVGINVLCQNPLKTALTKFLIVFGFLTKRRVTLKLIYFQKTTLEIGSYLNPLILVSNNVQYQGSAHHIFSRILKIEKSLNFFFVFLEGKSF